MSETKSAVDIYRVITNEAISSAVHKKIGESWKINDYEREDFTKKGDNYACIVTSVKIKCSNANGEEKEIQLIAKINPQRSLDLMKNLLNDFFIREGNFFTDVALSFNNILEEVGITPITFPCCYYTSYKNEEEILITEDLRQKGFIMFDRRKGIDLNRAELVVRALAKLHASSFVFKNRLSNETILDVYPFLFDTWLKGDSAFEGMMNMFSNNGISNFVIMIKQIGTYEKHYKKLEELKENCLKLIKSLIESTDDKWKVVCHGDCWNNNFLFKSDCEDKVQEIALLDLQLCRYASLAFDLSYFLNTSVSRNVLENHHNDLLQVYYDQFEEIIKAFSLSTPFTFEELCEEVKSKFVFGLIMAIGILPMVISETEELLDFAEMNDDNLEEMMELHAKKLQVMFEKNSNFKNRLVGILEQMTKNNFI